MEKKAERFRLNSTSGKIVAGIVVIGLIIALATILLIPKTTSAVETGQTRTITDMTGRTIEVPEPQPYRHNLLRRGHARGDGHGWI